MEAVSQRGQVFVDFLRPYRGVSPVLEEAAEIEAAGGTSAAVARSTLVFVSGRVEVGGNPCHDIVDEFALVTVRLGVPSPSSRVTLVVSEELVPVVTRSGHGGLLGAAD